MCHDRRGPQQIAGDNLRSHPAELGRRTAGPELGTQQAKAHLNEPVPKVHQHDISPPRGDGILIEGHGSFLLGHRVPQAVVACLPPDTRKVRQSEAAGGNAFRCRHLCEVLAMGEPDGRPNHSFDCRGGQVQLSSATGELVDETLQVTCEITFHFEGRAAGAPGDLSLCGLPVGTPTEHLLLDLRRDHLTRATEVLANLVDLAGRHGKKVEFVLESSCLKGSLLGLVQTAFAEEPSAYPLR